MTHELIILTNQFNEVKKARGKAKIPMIRTFATEPGREGNLFKAVYNFVFNPFIKTGIAKKKIEKNIKPTFIESLPLENMLEYIMCNNTGSDIVISNLKGWILQQPEETHEFLKCVFTNDLQIGASEKAINEALGYEFIPVWEIMLGLRWEKHEHKIKDGDEFFVTLKLDDYRVTCIFNEEKNKWEFKARSGLLFEEMTQIEEIFKDIPKHFVLDGGVIANDPREMTSKERYRLTKKIMHTDGEKIGLDFVLYDMLPKDEFESGKSKLGYKDRQKVIEETFDYGLLDENFYGYLLKRVPRLYQGTDKEVIMPLLQKVLEEEHEGLMVNTAKGKYERKRSDQLLKVKEFHTVDLKVIDTFEHKHPNKLGGFICEYKDGNTVRVGGGFKDWQREQWWEKRNEFIGTIIEVRYFQESENEKGGKSIRHGHFVDLRPDKTEPSYD